MIILLIVPALPVSAALSVPPDNYRDLFFDKSYPPIDDFDDYEYFLLILYPDSHSYRLLVSHSYFIFDELVPHSGIYDYVCYLNGNTNGVRRYNSSDGVTYTLSDANLFFSSSNFDNVIYYCNFEVVFLKQDGYWEDFSFTPDGGKFLEYYDYYNFTNYSGLNTVEISESSESSGTSWNFGDLFGGIGGILSSGFSAISNFFTNFWNGLSSSLSSLFVPSEQGMQTVRNNFANKLDFVQGFQNAFNVFNNTQGQTLNYEFTWLDGKQYAIDFSWYEDYRLNIRALSSAAFYLFAFIKCFNMISSVFRVDFYYHYR